MSGQSGSPECSPCVVILSGPSGSGKSTVIQRLLKEAPVPLRFSISATTRAPRPGEQNGREYHFLSREEFEQRLAAGEFLEYAEVHRTGNLYGTLWSELETARQLGKWSLLDIDVEGARRVLDRYPHAVTIFLRTPSEREYEDRLRKRGTETEEMIQKRLATARAELACANEFEYQVINDQLDRAVAEIARILEARKQAGR